MDVASFQDFNNKRVLVTGGGGFIGSHLVKRLLEEGAKVAITSRGVSWRLRISDVEDKIEIFNFDVADENKVKEGISIFKPEYVFHLAAYGVDSKDQEYLRAVNTNIIGTVNILNAAAVYGCNRFINIGSCAEYGDRREAMAENMCLEPVTIYGSTKACATIMTHQLAREKDIEIVTLRPFGIFGEGEERHKLFSHVIGTILEDNDVELSPCEQMRDYSYVENIVDGLMLAALNKNIKNEIFNIGTGELHPLKYYIDLIFKSMNTVRRPIYGAIEYRSREMWAPLPDIRKIKDVLGWEPRVNLEEGIDRTVRWFREKYENHKI